MSSNLHGRRCLSEGRRPIASAARASPAHRQQIASKSPANRQQIARQIASVSMCEPKTSQSIAGASPAHRRRIASASPATKSPAQSPAHRQHTTNRQRTSKTTKPAHTKACRLKQRITDQPFRCCYSSHLPSPTVVRLSQQLAFFTCTRHSF